MTRWTRAEEAWLAENYGSSDVHETASELNRRFGNSRTEKAVYTRASKLGLVRPEDEGRRRGAERPVFWSREPEMAAFMAENDKGSRPAAARKFEERLGIRLTPEQVSAYRAFAGTQSKRGRTTAQDWHRKPIGYEKESQGYIIVKVRENPSKPGTKDNWRLKHVMTWEESNGTELPEGFVVLFADGDRRNFDPDNLVAVPRRLVGIINSGPKWHDRQSLDAAVALAKLKNRANDLANGKAVCGVCGKEFKPDIRPGKRGASQRTCRECLSKGLRSRKEYGSAVCPSCGREFRKSSASHAFCSKGCRYAHGRDSGRCRP